MSFRHTYLPVLALCFWGDSVFAQFKTQLAEMGEVQWSVKSDGQLFMQSDSTASSHLNGMPKAHFLKYTQLWALGEADGDLYASASTSRNPEFWPGPIDTLTGIAKDPYDWDEVWSVSRDEVNQHIRNYSSNTYVMPDGIANWPAKHSAVNLAPYVAAFADWNGNGFYDPEGGDYPYFIGDRVYYSISNDEYGEHLHSAAGKLKLEQYQTLYGFEEKGFEKIIFGRIVLVNRSDKSYSPFYFGHLVDAEIGNRTDNRMGTLADQNAIWFYNGDDEDEGNAGFGKSNPASAFMYLNRDLYASVSFNEGDAVRGFPSSASEIQNCLSGFWKNGAYKTMNGDGTGKGDSTQYIYPGNSDPKNPSVNWRDEDSKDGPGERLALMSSKLDVFEPGNFIDIDFAIVLDTGVQSESHMRELLNRAVNRYRTISSSTHTTVHYEPIWFWPNPASTMDEIQINKRVHSLEVADFTGRTVYSANRDELEKTGHKLRLSERAAGGIYWLVLNTDGGRRTARMVLH